MNIVCRIMCGLCVVALLPTGVDAGAYDAYMGEHIFAGYPDNTRSKSEFVVLESTGFVVGYSESYKVPLWTAYRCEWKDNAKSPGKRPRRFKIDKRTTARVKHVDYKQSDYNENPRSFDRGHMAPNFAIGSRYGRAAQLQTFFMSNVCPQRSTLNQQTWEALEKRIATDYAWDCDEVWVIVGPIFKKSSAKRLNGVAAIPNAFYAIIVDVETFVDDDDSEYEEVRAIAVILNQSVKGIKSLRQFVTTIDEIENRTGLDFFIDLPDGEEDALEDSAPDEWWELDRVMMPSRWTNR